MDAALYTYLWTLRSNFVSFLSWSIQSEAYTIANISLLLNSLLAIYFSVSSLQGFEVPALAYIGNIVDGRHNNEIFSRCISNLIIIALEKHVKNYKDDTCITINQILGKFLFWRDNLIRQSSMSHCSHSFMNIINLILNPIFLNPNFHFVIWDLCCFCTTTKNIE